jgi:O-antigen biosynthesis protein
VQGGFSSVRGMEPQGRNDLAPDEEVWASLLVRTVGYLADRLPEAHNSADGEGRHQAPVYGPDAAHDDPAYQAWLSGRAAARRKERAGNRRALALQVSAPALSVIVAGTAGSSELLGRTAASIRDQDLPTVDVAERVERSVCVGSIWNRVAMSAFGDFLAFVEAGDELEPGVLADIALTLAGDPQIDMVYTDSDWLDEQGQRVRPFFKPDWSPDQLLSHMYIGRLMVIRRSLFEAVGGFRTEFQQSAEYDLALRVSERARRIVRLPVVGYHRRSVPAEPDDDLTVLALEDALRRRGEQGRVESGLCPGTFRVRRPVRGVPVVSVIVPFHNGAEHLRRCIRSLQDTAGYDRWEAILVDNRSWDPNTRALLARLGDDPRIRVVSYPDRFNWAAINNFAAKQSAGTHLLFMNADVEGRSRGWMLALLEHSQRPEIGAVGARLLYPNGRVQHAGVVMGLGGGIAWHAFCYCPEESSGYYDQAKVIRNYSAVTGACMMVRHEVFERVGGFGEDLPVAYNDVDFCLRVQEHGYRVVYTPFAELIHDESFTRGRVPPDRYAVETMEARWGERISGDPYYNPNLCLHRPEAALISGEGGV